MADHDLTQGRALRGKKKSREDSHVRGLYALNLFGALSAAENARFTGMTAAGARLRLDNMVAEGLAGRASRMRASGAGRPLVRYFVKRPGYDLAVESQIIDSARMGPFRTSENETKFTKSPKHKAGVMNAMISAYLHAEQTPGVAVESVLTSFRPDPVALDQKKRDGNHRKGAVPRETTMIGSHEGQEIRCTFDGAFMMNGSNAHDRVLFAVEYDRGFERIASRDGIQGMTSDSIEGKCRLVMQFLIDGTMRNVFGTWASAYVLFIAPSDKRVDTMMSGVRWDMLPKIGDNDPRGFFRFTTEAEAERRFLGPIWRQPGVAGKLPLCRGAL